MKIICSHGLSICFWLLFFKFRFLKLLEAVFRSCSVKKVSLKISENTCARASFSTKLQAGTLLKKRLPQVFTCELCEIFKNTYFNRYPPVAASALYRLNNENLGVKLFLKQNFLFSGADNSHIIQICGRIQSFLNRNGIVTPF